jgi:hypothetical protein
MRGINAASLQSLITTLKNAIVVGAGITASDVNQVIAAYNTWITHNHRADDLRGVDTFGNVPFYGGGTWAADPTSTEARNTSNVAFPNNGFLNAINDQIDDTDVNSFINSINNIRSHKHRIFDTTS